MAVLERSSPHRSNTNLAHPSPTCNVTACIAGSVAICVADAWVLTRCAQANNWDDDDRDCGEFYAEFYTRFAYGREVD
jgi:hypothetical protein